MTMIRNAGREGADHDDAADAEKDAAERLFAGAAPQDGGDHAADEIADVEAVAAELLPRRDERGAGAKGERTTSTVNRNALLAAAVTCLLVMLFAAASSAFGETTPAAAAETRAAPTPRVHVPKEWHYAPVAPEDDVPLSEWQLYLQDRPNTQLGTDPAYKVLVQDEARIQHKRKRFDEIMEARQEHCGQFERHNELIKDIESQEEPDETGWQLIKGSKTERRFRVCVEPRKNCSADLHLLHQVCSFPDPSRDGVTVTIDRVGPFHMPGGYDWASASWMDVGGLRRSHFGKNFSVVGGMFLPTFSDGNPIGYPPIHIHHAHMYGYASRSERLKKTMVRYQVNTDLHHVLLQAHGDSECKASEGGLACLLDELEDDEGYALYNLQTGFASDFDLNNVLNEPLDGVYLDVVILHKETLPKRPVTYLHSGNGCFGTGPCTYDIPADPSSSVMWHRFQFPFSGTAREFHLHTHQTMADSVFVFRGPKAFEAIEPFRQDKPLPTIIECNDKLGGSLEAAKQTLLAAITAVPGVELLCELTKPGLAFDCDAYAETGECLAYDKRVALRCLSSLRVSEGEELTFVAFNRAPPRHWISRQSAYFHKTLIGKEFALKQHTILRMQFVHDSWNAAQPYLQPPALYNYATLPQTPGSMTSESESGKSVIFTPIEKVFAKITASCPANISYTM